MKKKAKASKSVRFKSSVWSRFHVDRTLGAALAVFAFWLLAKLEPYVWLGRLAAELALYGALTALVIAGFAGRHRRWPALAVALLALGGLLVPLAPLYRSQRPTPEAGPKLTVMHAHLAGEVLGLARVTDWLTGQTPDIAALTGVSTGDLQQVPASLAGYRIRRRADGESRSLLFVRDTRAATGRERATGHLSAVIRAGRCDVRLLVVDLPSAFAFRSLDQRAAAVRALEHEEMPARSIWLGHLGSRVEASDLVQLVSANELRDTRRGYGRLATAPAALAALGFPLDHVLVHGWVGVRERSVASAPIAGAHRTVHAVLELTEPRCRP